MCFYLLSFIVEHVGGNVVSNIFYFMIRLRIGLHLLVLVGFSESKRSTEEDPTTGRQGAEPPDGPPASTVTISKIGTEEKCLIKTISEHQDMEKLITDREQNMPRPPGTVPPPGGKPNIWT